MDDLNIVFKLIIPLMFSMGKNWAVTINDKKGGRKTVKKFTHKKRAKWFAAEIARNHKGSGKGVNPRIKKIKR